MTKVKFFENHNIQDLEKAINSWIGSEPNTHIISLSGSNSIHPSGYTIFAAYIIYETRSALNS